jgi:hypothetical protein
MGLRGWGVSCAERMGHLVRNYLGTGQFLPSLSSFILPLSIPQSPAENISAYPGFADRLHNPERKSQRETRESARERDIEIERHRERDERERERERD